MVKIEDKSPDRSNDKKEGSSSGWSAMDRYQKSKEEPIRRFKKEDNASNGSLTNDYKDFKEEQPHWDYRKNNNRDSNDRSRQRGNQGSGSRELPFQPTLHNIDKPHKDLNQKPYWKALVDGIKDYDFEKPDKFSVAALKLLISRFGKESLPSLPLGTFNRLM